MTPRVTAPYQYTGRSLSDDPLPNISVGPSGRIGGDVRPVRHAPAEGGQPVEGVVYHRFTATDFVGHESGYVSNKGNLLMIGEHQITGCPSAIFSSSGKARIAEVRPLQPQLR